MILPSKDPFMAIHLAANYGHCLNLLKNLLERAGCKTLAEVPLHREIEREIGMQLRKYTVLVVWDPFQTYQELLGEKSAGLLLPFHFLVADLGDTTLVAALNLDLIARSASTLAVRLLLRNLDRKIWSIFSELHKRDRAASVSVQAEQTRQALPLRQCTENRLADLPA